ncbi:MAG: bacillithiol biosynthesis deacetylase BshB1 [Saprospiraceae bacterium]
MQKIDILAIGVHPDDVELSCSGTLLRHIRMGKTVGLLDLTRGELGTRGTADIRDQEALDAARLMGAAFRWNANMADGFFQHTPENVKKIASFIRASQPDIVLANALSDRHPDHGRAAKLTADACFYSGLAKIETFDADGFPQAPWRPKAIYHYIQDNNLTPDFVVDITEFIDRKMELVLAFKSQFYVPEATEYAQEASTPISGAQFRNFLRAKAATYGRIAGFDFAEGFNVARTLRHIEPLRFSLTMYILRVSKVVAYLCWALCVSLPIMAQQGDKNLVQRLLIVGDADGMPHAALWQHLQQTLDTCPASTTLVWMGDLTRQGMPLPGSKEYATTTSHIDSLLALSHHCPGRTWVIPGDKDWQRGLPGGMAAVNRLEDYILAQAPPALQFAPHNACGDPTVWKVDKDLVFIFIDSQWWLQSLDDRCQYRQRLRHQKPQ